MNTSSTLLIYLLPMAVVAVMIWFMMRRLRGPSIETLLKSPVQPVQPSITFEDVGGLDQPVEELRRIIHLFKSRPRGVNAPSGVLLTGEPGTGKTRLAHAAGGEARVLFWEAPASEFGGMFIGTSASRIRDLFAQARKQTPCLVFIDNLDVIARPRIAGNRMAERQQNLSQLCIELDALSPSLPVLVIAATNRPDLLDPALLRSGRLERRIHLPRPDAAGREQILRIHTRKRSLSMEVNLSEIAAATEGFVGADLERLVNEAALGALRAGRKAIAPGDFESAIQRVAETVQRTSAGVSQQE
jgi:cell division protease FtsH